MFSFARLYVVTTTLTILLLVGHCSTNANNTATNTTTTTTSSIDKLRSKLDINITIDESLTAENAASVVMEQLGLSIQQRLTKLYQDTKTVECRIKIAKHFSYFLNAIGKEESLPFTSTKFINECTEPVYEWNNLPDNIHLGMIQNRTYQPPKNETEYIDDPSNLKLLYAMLTHDNPTATIRLIEALYEPNLHTFVIHVDGKYDDTQQILLDYAADKDYIHILTDQYRVRVNWGGFSMVNATLQTLRYAFGLLDDNNEALDFHKVVHVSSSTYPLASNVEIRHKIASYPLDANFVYVILNPNRQPNQAWHYFVECDDKLHRIYQLPPMHNAIHGIDTFTSSQWFIISREFAEYLALAEPGSFVNKYLKYIEHVVVADETFFGTVLRHTKYCTKHHNQNFLHLQFDRWESDIPQHSRDIRKCPMPDPNHCGRSPTTMTIDYADIMELSADLFARKFDDTVDTQVKDIIDRWRTDRGKAIMEDGVDPSAAFQMKNLEFEGYGVLIVAKETVNDEQPLCLSLGESGNKAMLLPCFHEWVPPTLAENWESGAVISKETIRHTRWNVGPCTSDGKLERLDSGEIQVTLGNYSATGPRCMLQQADGLRVGRCLDGGTGTFQPGGETQVYPCVREWFQFFSFGDGKVAPKGSLYSSIPSHIVKQIHNMGHEHIPHMCLGVYERGDADEIDWDDEEYKQVQKERAEKKRNGTSETLKEEDLEPLSEWVESNIITTQCTNTGGVVEWVFVPFIIEDEEDDSDDTQTSSPTDQPNEDDEEL